MAEAPSAPGKVAVLTTGGLWVLGTINGAQISLVDFTAATGLSIVGAASYQFLRAYVKREAEAANGLPSEARSVLDTQTLAYACLAAPLATALLFYLISILGGTANSLYSIGGFYAAGALAPQLIPNVLGLIARFMPSPGKA